MSHEPDETADELPERGSTIVPLEPPGSAGPFDLTDDPAFAATLQAWGPTLLEAHLEPSLSIKPTSRAARDAASRPKLPPRRIARGEDDAADYTLGEVLGVGGMGEVYEAQQSVLQRSIAIKLIKAGSDPDAADRFVAEALIAGQLEHPNIVPVYDLGRTQDDRLYMGMKRVRGEELATLLHREPATTPERLRRYLDVLSRVADALAYAHSRGVIHRDLKPSNVMVGEFGEVQLMDWGLAVRLDAEGRAPRDAAPGGTPAYMAPEQAGHDVERFGPHTDVYLLGSTLYHVLTGSLPHRGDSALATLYAALQGEVEPPSARAPDREIPSDLEALCLEAMHPDVAQRLPTATAFREAIERYQDHGEALRLINGARPLLADDADASLHERGERLTRASVGLQQALELWPESEAADDLLQQVLYLQANLALEQGEPGRALALVEQLRPERPESAARQAEIRGRAGRQTARTLRNIILVLLAAVLTLAGVELNRRGAKEAAKQAEQRTGRREMAQHTARAWYALRTNGSPNDINTALRRVADRTLEADWLGETDWGWLTVAVAWDALRRGDLDGALNHSLSLLAADASSRDRQRLRAVSADPELRLDPIESVRAWRDHAERKTSRVPRFLSRLVEAVLFARGVRALPPARLEAETPRLRKALDALVGRAVLADARSGLPGRLFGDSPRTSTTLVPHGAGFARVVVGLDPRTGRELWSFPPPALRSRWGSREEDLELVSPALLMPDGEGELVMVLAATELLGLDPKTGQVRSRLRLHHYAGGVLPDFQRGRMLVFHITWGGQIHGSGRSVVLSATPRELRTQPAGFTRAGYHENERPALLRELDRLLDEGRPPAPKDDRPEPSPAELRRQLGVLARVRARDPSHPFLDHETGWRLHELGEVAAARARLERLLQADLSPLELVYIADHLDAHHSAGLGRLPERLVARAVEVYARAGGNPGLNLVVHSNPAHVVRRMAISALEADPARARRLMDLSRELAPVMEGDIAYLAREQAWLRANGQDASADALTPYVAEAERSGGVYMLPTLLLESLEPAVVSLVAFAFLVALGALVLWLRTRRARAADLRALGFDTPASRALASLTNPVVGLRHTFLAYASRGERAALLLGAGVAITALLYTQAFVTTLWRLSNLPAPIRAGQLGHPSARSRLQTGLVTAEGAARRGRLRLLAESDLMLGKRSSATRRLKALLALDPDDPFALNNLGFLAERAERPRDARSRYEQAARAPGDGGAVARANLARLDGRSLPPLPVAYRAYLRADPTAPLRQLAAIEDLRAALRVRPTPWGIVATFAQRVAALEDPLFTDPETVRALRQEHLERGPPVWGLNAPVLSVVIVVTQLAQALAIPLLLLLVFALLHLPLPSRPAGDPTSDAARNLERLGQAANLVLPGALWLARGRLAAGIAACSVAPLLWTIAYVAGEGGTLLTVVTNHGSHAYPGTSGLVVSSLMSALGPVAWALLVALYGAAWVAGIRAWRRRRADPAD